jgi:hypothetical protein
MPHRVYPNPAVREVTIECSEQDPVIFRSAIFDMSGQVIETFDHENAERKISLDVSRINPGCYVLKIYSAHAVQTRKLIIVKS